MRSRILVLVVALAAAGCAARREPAATMAPPPPPPPVVPAMPPEPPPSPPPPPPSGGSTVGSAVAGVQELVIAGGAGRPADGSSPAATAPEPLAPCGPAGRLLTAEACAADAEMARAPGAFNAPDAMVVGQRVRVRFVLDRAGDAAAVAARVERMPGRTVRVAPMAGRFMRAVLSGDGFDIAPLAEERQEVLAGSSAVWEWDVTARVAGEDRVLTLATFVEYRRPDGSFDSLKDASEDHLIDVTVTGGQAAERLVAESETWMKRGETWLGALAALITAVGVVFAAVRALRSGGGAPAT